MIELQRSEYFAFTSPWLLAQGRDPRDHETAAPCAGRPADIAFRFSRSARNSGLAVFPGYPSNPHIEAGWNLIIRRDLGRRLTRWVLLHEFGHALGLEHPGDDSDVDSWPGATIGPEAAGAGEGLSRGFIPCCQPHEHQWRWIARCRTAFSTG